MTDRYFALPPTGKVVLVFTGLVGVVIPLIVAVSLAGKAGAGEIDIPVAIATLAFVSVVVLAVLLPLWRRQVAFDGRRLRVKATYYTREAPMSDFRLEEARVVDLRERTELRPFVKTNGAALPGFYAGHFRLRELHRKAFCLVTDPSRVLALPHADGSVWLLSFEHPQAVLDTLWRAAG